MEMMMMRVYIKLFIAATVVEDSFSDDFYCAVYPSDISHSL